MTKPFWVDIPGIGELPHRFTQEFDGVDFHNQLKDNRHHEGRVSLTCGEENWGINDDFNVSGWKTAQGYQIDVYIESDSIIGLFHQGRVVLDYDQTERHWSVKGYVAGVKGRREWKLCDPASMIDVVTAGLDCFGAARDHDLGDAIRRITESIRGDRDVLIAHSTRYTKAADCAVQANPLDECNSFLCLPPD